MITKAEELNIIGVPVMNNRDVLDWLVKHQTKCYKDNKKSLSSDLRKELTEVFGKQHKTITYEFRKKAWTLNYKDLTFSVYSAGGYGTSIEICNFDSEDIRLGKEKEIIEFLTELSNILNDKKI